MAGVENGGVVPDEERIVALIDMDCFYCQVRGLLLSLAFER